MSVDVVVRLAPEEWHRLVAEWKERARRWALIAALGWLAFVAAGISAYLGCGQ